MKKYLLSGLINNYRIKTYIYSTSPVHAIKIFKQKFQNAEDIYVIQEFFKKKN